MFVCFFLFVCLFVWLQSMWDLSFPTSDRTHPPCLGRRNLNPGPPGMSQISPLIKLKASTTTRDAWKSLQLLLHRLPPLRMPGAQVPPRSFPTPPPSKWRPETAGRNPESLRPCQCKMLTAWIPPHIHWSSGATVAARSGFSSYESEGTSLGVPGWTYYWGCPQC